MAQHPFLALGEVVPPAFDPDVTGKYVAPRLAHATGFARQLRCSDELLLTERRPGARIPTLGDQVVRADDAGVLALVGREHDSLEGLTRLRELRSIYGYDNEEWEKPGRRRPARIAVCLATDATFAPYARGALDAMRLQQASLRIDLLAAGAAIWAWARDHRALSRCLALARDDVAGFPAFARLYARVLSTHQDTGLDVPERLEEIASLATALAGIATGAVAVAYLPGTSDARVNRPAIDHVVRRHPDWIPELADSDALDNLARGLSGVVFEVLLEQRDPVAAAADIDTIGQGLREVGSGGALDA